MLKFIAKRIIIAPILLALSSLLIFFMINITPVDPASQILVGNYTQEQVDQLHEELGLDDPIIVQYGRWLWNVLHGDFGKTYTTDRTSVAKEVLPRIPVSLSVAFLTMLVVIIIGLPLGVLCAVKQYSIADTIINLISKVLGSIPQFLVGLLLLLLFGVKLHWLPTFGFTSPKHYILPVATLALPQIATYVRTTRSSMLDCIRKDYIRTARAKGATERIVIFRDALKNALLPIITMTGTEFAKLIGGAIVVENVFAIPGLGSRVILAINQKDIPTTLCCVLFLSIFFIVVTLIMDILYTIVDPRVKSTIMGGEKKKKTPRKVIVPTAGKGAEA